MADEKDNQGGKAQAVADSGQGEGEMKKRFAGMQTAYNDINEGRRVPKALQDLGIADYDALRARLAAEKPAPGADAQTAGPQADAEPTVPLAEDFLNPDTGEVDRAKYQEALRVYHRAERQRASRVDAEEGEVAAIQEAAQSAPAWLRDMLGEKALADYIGTEADQAKERDWPLTQAEVQAGLKRLVEKFEAGHEKRRLAEDEEASKRRAAEPTIVDADATARPSAATGQPGEDPIQRAVRQSQQKEAALVKARGG